MNIWYKMFCISCWYSLFFVIFADEICSYSFKNVTKVKKSDNRLSQKEIRINERDMRMFKRVEKIIVDEKRYLIPRLSREELIVATNIPKNKFAPLFRKCTDKSFTTFLNDLRLDYTVEAVAQECGLPKMQTFYRLFMERYKMTPSHYRRKK